MTQEHTLPNTPANTPEEEDVVSEALNLPDASPKKMLAAWANEQDEWVRHAVTQIIASNRSLGEAELDELTQRYLIEKNFADGEVLPVPSIELHDEATAAEDVLELQKLSEVEGVNALAAGQAVIFDPNLTILWGQNGAGKTGYSRVLKRVAAVRTAEPILPNAHSTSEAKPPAAKISYSLNGNDDELDWHDQAGVAPFTRISVFDAPAVNLHVDDDLNYIFTPGELALFSHVGDAIRHVQRQIASEASDLRSSGNPFLIHFRRGSSIYPLIESVGATTDVAELSALADVSPEGEQRVQELNASIVALKAGSVEARLQTVTQESSRIGVFLNLTKAIDAFEPPAYSANLKTLRNLEADRRRVRGELFDENELPAEPDDEWAGFVTEADHYREHLGRSDYPVSGDHCLYCGQTLDDKSIALIKKYRTFLEDTLAKQVAEARKNFRASQLHLAGVSLEVVGGYLSQVESGDSVPAYAKGLRGVLDAVKDFKVASDSELALPEVDLKKMATEVHRELTTAEGSVSEALIDLKKQKDERVETLAAQEKEYAELVAKRTLGRHLPAIEGSVKTAKRSARMDDLAKRMSSGLLRPLTNLSKAASEELANRNFQRLFEEECVALRAPAVALEFQGREGQAERRKAVAKHKPSAILSEGEQKVLAIADFLAECRMSGVKAPIIFDDPVTSLDYLRLNEVAERISRLAETHQVVVFTHNVFFASALLALRNNKKLRAKFYEVKSSDSEKGVITADVEPRLDTPVDIGKKINVLIQDASTATGPAQEALVESGYGLLRSWCEAFVEQEVLQNVTQRFRVNVMMGGLEKINLERFEDTVAAISPMFDRCSRFMPGHSQPTEQLNVRPKLDEFQEDWRKMQEVRKQHIAN